MHSIQLHSNAIFFLFMYKWFSFPCSNYHSRWDTLKRFAIQAEFCMFCPNMKLTFVINQIHHTLLLLFLGFQESLLSLCNHSVHRVISLPMMAQDGHKKEEDGSTAAPEEESSLQFHWHWITSPSPSQCTAVYTWNDRFIRFTAKLHAVMWIDWFGILCLIAMMHFLCMANMCLPKHCESIYKVIAEKHAVIIEIQWQCPTSFSVDSVANHQTQ